MDRVVAHRYAMGHPPPCPSQEAERKRLHEEQLIARAFETDRLKRIAILESYDEGGGAPHLRRSSWSIVAIGRRLRRGACKCDMGELSSKEVFSDGARFRLMPLAGCGTLRPRLQGRESATAWQVWLFKLGQVWADRHYRKQESKA